VGQSAVTKIGGSGGGSKITVNQSNSFSAGDVVRYDSGASAYVRALATKQRRLVSLKVLLPVTLFLFLVVRLILAVFRLSTQTEQQKQKQEMFTFLVHLSKENLHKLVQRQQAQFVKQCSLKPPQMVLGM
jgi:hypothetical protein